MEKGMKVIILMESNMVWVSIFSLMVNVMKASTSKASKMAKELTFIWTKRDTKVPILMVDKKVMVNTTTLMEVALKDPI